MKEISTLEMFRLLLAQQVVLFKKIEDLEYKVKGGGFRLVQDQTYADELRKEAEKIVDQIKL